MERSGWLVLEDGGNVGGVVGAVVKVCGDRG